MTDVASLVTMSWVTPRRWPASAGCRGSRRRGPKNSAAKIPSTHARKDARKVRDLPRQAYGGQNQMVLTTRGTAHNSAPGSVGYHYVTRTREGGPSNGRSRFCAGEHPVGIDTATDSP